MERQIDREIAADKKYAEFSQGTDFNDGDDTDLSDAEDLTEYAPLPQIVTNDLKSLDEMVSTVIEIFNGWSSVKIEILINYRNYIYLNIIPVSKGCCYLQHYV